VNNGVLSGAGTLGDGNLTLTNNSLIESDEASPLTIDTGSHTVSNNGIILLDGNGGLSIAGDFNNSGAVLDLAGTLFVGGTVSGTGSTEIGGGTAVDFAGGVAKEQTEQFAGTGAKLDLGQAQSFAGTVVGLASGDAIDLQNFAFSGAKITSITGKGTAGSDTDVTIKDDLLSETLILLNQFSNQYSTNASAYTLISDGSEPTSGTLFMLTPHR
jgi:hypothetical protein